MRHYGYVNKQLQVRLEKKGLYESFERYFQEEYGKTRRRKSSLNLAMDRFARVLQSIEKVGMSIEEALAREGLREYAKSNLGNLPAPLSTPGGPAKAPTSNPDGPPTCDDLPDAPDVVDEWPKEWSEFDPTTLRGRKSTIREDVRWVYDNCVYNYENIDPDSAPSSGALGWITRVKRSPETLDTFYKSVLIRFLHSKSEQDEDENLQDSKLLRLLGKVEAASRKAKEQTEAEDGGQDAALPPGPERDSGKPRVSSGHVGVGG